MPAPVASAFPTVGVTTGSVSAPTAAPTDVPSPSPTLSAAAIIVAPGKLQASGVAPLRVGTHLTQGAATSPLAVWKADACAGTDVPGRWVGPFPEVFGPYSLWTDNSGELTRIDVWSKGPHLEGGIGIGSSLAELQSAQPDATLIASPAASGDMALWQINDANGIVVLEISNDEKVYQKPDGTILAMSILAAGDPHGFLDSHARSYHPAYGGEVCG